MAAVTAGERIRGRMKVEVVLAPPYADASGGRPVPVGLDEGAAVSDCLDRLAQAFPALGKSLRDARGRLLLGSEFFVTVNERIAKSGDTLHDGDRLRIFPAIGGGEHHPAA